MKLLFVVSVLCLTLANGFLFRIPTPEHPILATAAPAGVTEYFTAFFAHFDLDQPNQILNCFDDKNAVLFWKELDLTSDLAQNIEERNHVKVHLGWGELVLLEKALEPLHGCMAATQDFSDLLHALGAEERNPKLFMIAQYVYFQANYGKLSQELPKVVEAIKNKDWKGAGELKASIVQSMADELKDKGLALQALDALWNGVHIELGLGDAQSVFGCWNKETAHVRLEFIWGMAKAVVDGKWIDAATSVEKWYQEKGNALLEKIPESTWQCWGKSADTKVESEKLKIDLSSHEFHEKVNNFVHRHPAAFWHMQKNIHDALKEHNMMHAGAEYGHVMKAAVNSKW